LRTDGLRFGADGLLFGADRLLFGADGLLFGADELLLWVLGSRTVLRTAVLACGTRLPRTTASFQTYDKGVSSIPRRQLRKASVPHRGARRDPTQNNTPNERSEVRLARTQNNTAEREVA
jgi:hypothetical protein